METVSGKSYSEIKEVHLKDFRGLFDRVTLNLGVEDEALKLPTDERLIRFNSGKSDLQLVGTILPVWQISADIKLA